MLTPLTGEVEGEVLERASLLIGVAFEDIGVHEPLDKVAAVLLDNRVVDRLQLHFEGDAGIAEFVCTTAALINLLVAATKELVDGIRGPPDKTIRLFLDRTAEGQCKSLDETQAKIPTTQNTECLPQY